MAYLSSNILISSLSLLHLTVAYFLLTSPVTVTRHGMVLVLSSAFELPFPSASSPSPTYATTWLATLFAFIGLTDLFSANLQDEVRLIYWSSQAPLRTFFMMLVAGWGFLAGPKGLQSMGAAPSPRSFGPLSEGLVFAWAFMELVVWFWVFLTVRDERRAVAVRRVEGL